MTGRAPLSAAFVMFLGLSTMPDTVANGQVTIQPTPAPIVTAENEPWYLEGEPITFSGSLYYPAGAHVFFNGWEMVRSGHYRGIPLYTRTTIEPFSKVFVPLSGGLMQPYERRRAGDLAGTVGSTVPSFPVVSPSERYAETGVTPGIAQAAAPPTLLGPVPSSQLPGADTQPAIQPSPSGTAGAAVPGPAPTWGPLVSAAKPQGLNGVFIEFENRRWFSSGPAVEMDPSRFLRIGTYHGFPVFAERGDQERRIYVVVQEATPQLLAPYSVRR